MTSLYDSEKSMQINEWLDRPVVDLEKIRRSAVEEHGLVNSQLRATVWPMLLGVNSKSRTAVPSAGSFIPDEPMLRSDKHGYEEQIELDIRRSYGEYPPDITSEVRTSMQDELSVLINKLISRNRQLHYYQGYHDVIGILAQVLSTKDQLPSCERLSQFHLRSFMAANMNEAMAYLSAMFPIISVADPELYDFFLECGLTDMPHFALSWVLTFFSHSLPDIDEVGPIFDALLSYPHPLLVVYLCSAYIMSRRKIILSQDCEFSVAFKAASEVTVAAASPKLIAHALQMYDAYPPECIMHISQVQTSILKRWDVVAWSWLDCPWLKRRELIAPYSEEMQPIPRSNSVASIHKAIVRNKVRPIVSRNVQKIVFVLNNLQNQRLQTIQSSRTLRKKVLLATVAATLAAVVITRINLF